MLSNAVLIKSFENTATSTDFVLIIPFSSKYSTVFTDVSGFTFETYPLFSEKEIKGKTVAFQIWET